MTIDANFNGTNDTDTNLQFRFSGVSSMADPDLQRGKAGGGGGGGGFEPQFGLKIRGKRRGRVGPSPGSTNLCKAASINNQERDSKRISFD